MFKNNDKHIIIKYEKQKNVPEYLKKFVRKKTKKNLS